LPSDATAMNEAEVFADVKSVMLETPSRDGSVKV
jgi:hypothetical protein